MPASGVAGRWGVVPTLDLAAPVPVKLTWPEKVTVPVADSVVNAPVLGVMLPMGGGEAKEPESKGMEMLSTV